jgi:hypothetical protein
MIDLLPTHQMQRWKMDMLRYDFHVIHQPEMNAMQMQLVKPVQQLRRQASKG